MLLGSVGLCLGARVLADGGACTGSGSMGFVTTQSGNGLGPLPSGDRTREYAWRRPPSARFGRSGTWPSVLKLIEVFYKINLLIFPVIHKLNCTLFRFRLRFY